MSEVVRGMKSKTIGKLISKKLNAWIETIDDDSLKPYILNNIVVTGGCITSMLLGEQPNDFDIYFSNFEIAEKLAKYYANKLDSTRIISIGQRADKTGIELNVKQDSLPYNLEFLSLKELNKYNPLFISANAITLTDRIQLIFRFVGEADEIHKNYDFIHTTNYWTFRTGVVLNVKALEAILAKELKYIGSRYPLCSMFRLKKFIKRGWTVTAGEMLKIAWDINALDLQNIAVLQDQLVGVDYVYFSNMVSRLQTRGEAGNGPYDRDYLMDLIDEIFNGDIDND